MGLISSTDAIKSWNMYTPTPQGIGPLFMGGTRMGTNIENSVVNSFGQAHQIKNLFILGTGVFPTSGRDAPTQTIMALALRTAEHVIKYPS